MAIKILDVGQCGLDGPRMEKLWKNKLQAQVTRVDTGKDAVAALKNAKPDLVLVNRVLAMDGSSGLEVIEQLIEEGCAAPIALVSDLPEAQEEAIALGAVRGFGKADLDSPGTVKLVEKLARSGS